MSNSVFTYVVLVDLHSELLLLENIATAMLLHQQMALHIDHIEWGGEPDNRGSYRCAQDGGVVHGPKHPFHSSSHIILVHLMGEYVQ
jgi:hypothetical protein